MSLFHRRRNVDSFSNEDREGDHKRKLDVYDVRRILSNKIQIERWMNQSSRKRIIIIMSVIGLFAIIFMTMSFHVPDNNYWHLHSIKGIGSTKRPFQTFTNLSNINSTLFISNRTWMIGPLLDIQDTLPYDEVNLFDTFVLARSLQDDFQKSFSRNVQDQYSKQPYRSHAALTRRGYKGDGHTLSQINQDRLVIIGSEESDLNMSSIHKGGKNDFYMGIFDGHGTNGEMVSQLVSKRLFQIMTGNYRHFLSNQEKIGFEEILHHSFIDMDAQVVLLEDSAKPHSINGPIVNPPSKIFWKGSRSYIPAALYSGCTASIFIRLGNKLFSVNVGDSTSAIAVYSMKQQKSMILFQNRQDKPHLSEEKARIQKKGGIVIEPSVLLGKNLSSRVTNNDKSLGLAMSRAFGDLDAKKLGVIVNPVIQLIDIDKFKMEMSGDGIMFAVVMSDGLLEGLSEQDVVDEIGNALSQQGKIGSKSMYEVLQDLIMRSSRSWENMRMNYRDDISIAFHLISN